MQMTYRREDSAGYLTNWAGRLFVRALERRLGGASAGLMPVFFALSGGTSLAQKDLARLASVEQPTMAATLSRMERDGLVIRTPDPADGRSALIALTSKGDELAARALAAALEVNAAALRPLSEQDRRQFIDLLTRVIASLQDDGNESR